ncbi:DNA double-strand break repair protein Mre11 [Halomarina halobia]|uniref:DNA double-strand break repair protein Mre11 n=1 Tax=Halomarina halobia TaxID=3033386 RepID=A0ABD6ACP7_9EURY|nr:DNA double-strand break repair protein Mre11 [Halomarina sp. PSR21]
MTRVIHTGDTHIGYRQYHRSERRRDFLDAFEQVVEDAVADGVDAVVHAGDLFHDRRPDLPDLLGTLSALRTLDDADIPFLAVVGNHESKRDGQWLDLFESLGLAVRLDREPHVVGSTAFYGLDFVPRSQRAALDYEFADHDADHAALVTHGLFTPFDFGEWDAAEVLSSSTVAFDAMLLGDNHAADRAQVEGAWVTYCGSTERASADERADRGYNIVTFDGEVSIARRGLDTREFVFVDVELSPGEGIERVHERVDQHDLADAVVIVTVRGDGERITPAELEREIDERGALVARVSDHREFEEVRDLEVSFADPDEAVNERVRELGLSAAARHVDEVVRASKVADANVAEEVESLVAEIVEEGDPDALEAIEPTTGAAAADDAADATDAGGEESGAGSGETDSPSPSAPPSAEGGRGDGGSEGSEGGEGSEGSGNESGSAAVPEAGSETVATEADGAGSAEDQSTMGDF